MAQTILIVDDEINTLKVLAAALQNRTTRVETAQSGEEALGLLQKKKYSLVVSDFKMGGMSGEDLLEKTRVISPELPFILLTAHGTIELAVNAMRKGAYTYLTKPVNISLLEAIVYDILKNGSTKAVEADACMFQYFNIIGKTPAMQDVFSLIKRVSRTDANILILGESGTGKELVARAIHYTSLRNDKPFIPIDCTTIPAELMESELFGYEKGAFTCADERKLGLIEMAQGGTTFFDEIGDLDFALQKKLLRFLQEKEIRRIAGKGKIKVDVRVLSATNRDIEASLQNEEFRSDLFYRLNVITIRIPPLRERLDDVPLLANHYLEHFREKNKKNIREIDPEAMAILMNYDWPGNVRELENVLERAVILCQSDAISIESLPRRMQALNQEEQFVVKEFNLPEIERRTIARALDKTSWNQSEAARLLGISRKQLRTKMKNLKLFPLSPKNKPAKTR
ncbi:MAG: sigma-54-dependent Fis family transcriptional regulator [Deltaproteobacteria bacterium]|jgi:two-component system response regulator HydG/two-component system response regulator AtoC|nr:sigma-54-dependent Fis family transcriptional regulator [Deltaproteobacteria bacterium]